MTKPLRTLPVDLEELTIAFEAEAADLQWYLDSHTGEVLLVTREYEPAEHGGLTVTEIETDPTRFVRVPPADPQHAVDDMRSFADSVTDAQLKESLEIALSAARPDRRFKTALSWLPEQQHRWHAWRQERCRERVTQWLAAHGLQASARAA
jgi:hypothetical protein